MCKDGHLQEDLLNAASWLPTDPSTSSSSRCPSKLPTYSRTNLSYSRNQDLNDYIYSSGRKNLHMIQFDSDSSYVKHNRKRKVCCCWTVFSRSREITKTTRGNVKVMQDSVIYIDI